MKALGHAILAMLLVQGCTPAEVPPTLDNVSLISRSREIARTKLGTQLRIGADEIELYGVTLTHVRRRINFQQFYKSSWELYRLSNFSDKSYTGYLLRVNGRATSSDVKVEIAGTKAALTSYRQSSGDLIFTDASFDRKAFDRPDVGSESPVLFDPSPTNVRVIGSIGEIAGFLSDDVVYLYFDFIADAGVVILDSK